MLSWMYSAGEVYYIYLQDYKDDFWKLVFYKDYNFQYAVYQMFEAC
jgi:hypothetical protein